jgi:Domain of unknown function (DUF4412)
MKTIPTLIFILAARLCFADMTVTEKMQTSPAMNEPAKTILSTVTIKGKKARIEYDTTQPYYIVDLRAEKVYTVDREKKEVVGTPIEVMKKAGDMLSHMGSKSMKSSFQKTGTTKTINGYKCIQYHLTGTGPFSVDADFWISQDVNTQEFEPFKPLLQDLTRMMGSNELEHVTGMAIQTQSKMTMMGQTIGSSTEVQKITYDLVSDSLFEIPPEYSLRELPGLPKGDDQQ